jgi:hypothetical protein
MVLNNRGEKVFNFFSLNYYVIASKFLLLAFFILISLLFTQAVSAATLQEEWADQFSAVVGGTDCSQAVDGAGNIYVVGTTDAALAGQTHYGSWDGFLRKYDPQGNVLWTRQFGTDALDRLITVTADQTSVYIAGHTSGTFSGQTSQGGRDAYIRKYDSDGNFLWDRQFGTSGIDDCQGVAIYGSDIYVGGGTSGALSGQTSQGGQDAYIRKYDSSGNVIWTRQFGSSSHEYAQGITADNGGVYLGGGTTGSFGGTNDGSLDAFIHKLGHSGNTLWTRQFGSDAYDQGVGISSNGTNVYIVGFTSGQLPGQTQIGNDDAFIRQYDTDGNSGWTYQFGTIDYDYAIVVDTDANGVYVAGSVEGALPGQTYLEGVSDMFIRKYNHSGSIVWTEQFGTSGYDELLGVYIDGSDVYGAGYTDGAFPGFSDSGTWDAVIIKYIQDSDDDFIYDGVDTQVATSSDDFDDGDGTTGTITTRGDQILTIIDSATTSAGVFISADVSGGTATATISACSGSTTLDLTPGDEVTVTCGSVIYDVSAGMIEATFYAADDTVYTASISENNGIAFDPEEITFTAPANNQDTIILETEGEAIPVSPGETVELGNDAPIAGVIDVPLDPNNIANAISVSMPFTDPDANDTHTAVWDWGDGTQCDTSVDTDCSVGESSGIGTTTATHTYSTPGVYTLTVNISDSELTASSTFKYVVVYDPDGGFVTGGGWFNSPEGAYAPDANLTGKANFGFISKYHNGAQIPSGETQFQFKVADFRFHSDDYDWLVVNNAKAQYKGTGTVNGAGNHGFMLTAIDGALTQQGDNLFRIKIWDKTTDEVVYDNKMGADDDADPTTEIGGGNIVIHED